VSVGALQQLAEVRAVAHGELVTTHKKITTKNILSWENAWVQGLAVLLLWHGED